MLSVPRGLIFRFTQLLSIRSTTPSPSQSLPHSHAPPAPTPISPSSPNLTRTAAPRRFLTKEWWKFLMNNAAAELKKEAHKKIFAAKEAKRRAKEALGNLQDLVVKQKALEISNNHNNKRKNSDR